MASGEGKTQISAVVEDRYASGLDYIAGKEKRSRAAIIRFAIIEYLEKRKVVIEENVEQGT
jgi:predicted transcriptional regulator